MLSCVVIFYNARRMIPGSQIIGTVFTALFGLQSNQHQSQSLAVDPALGSGLMLLAIIAGCVIGTSFIVTRVLKLLI